MKNLIYIFIILFTLVSCNKTNSKNTSEDSDAHKEHQHSDEKTKKSAKKKVLSPHTSAMVMIGEAHIHIDYSSPGVRDRIIFGGLLPYNKVWQAGAHMATWIETNKDLEIHGNILKAGKYGFFIIPSQEEDWTIIFNSNWEQHGKDEYDEKDDVLRFRLKTTVLETIQEHLEYKVEKIDEESGTISLSWEKVNVHFPFKVIQ